MNHVKIHGLVLVALGLGLSANAQADQQLAMEYGCYSCHGAYLRSEAPSFARLTARLSKYKGDAAGQAKFVDKYRLGDAFDRVDAHERLSHEAATALVHWLAEGGK
jgi:cytochrome c551/c552